MFDLRGPNEATVIIDYGQKVEPTGQVESQSECFGKSGVSQFGATFLSSFEKTKLESMVGEERTKTIKPGDMVVFTVVLYNADSNQDWIHSLVSLRACIVLILERFPNIKTLCLRTDGAGNFRNSSFVLLMSKLSEWTGVTHSRGCNRQEGQRAMLRIVSRRFKREKCKLGPGGHVQHVR